MSSFTTSGHVKRHLTVYAIKAYRTVLWILFSLGTLATTPKDHSLVKMVVRAVIGMIISEVAEGVLVEEAGVEAVAGDTMMMIVEEAAITVVSIAVAREAGAGMMMTMDTGEVEEKVAAEVVAVVGFMTVMTVEEMDMATPAPQGETMGRRHCLVEVMEVHQCLLTHLLLFLLPVLPTTD